LNSGGCVLRWVGRGRDRLNNFVNSSYISKRGSVDLSVLMDKK
jgi:hypothetical protein